MGEKGVWRWGKRESIYLSLHCYHQNDSCIKMGSDESHFNVLLIVKDKVTRPSPQTTTFLKRKESRSGIEPRSFRLPAYRLTARPNRLSRWMSDCNLFIKKLNIHWSGVFTALFGWYVAGATWSCCRLGARSVYTIKPCTTVCSVTSCKATYERCMRVQL